MSEEVKFQVGGQWYYRGNRFPPWFALASRADGSACGISEKVPTDWWPILEEVARLREQLADERRKREIAELNAVQWQRAALNERLGEVEDALLMCRSKLALAAENSAGDDEMIANLTQQMIDEREAKVRAEAELRRRIQQDAARERDLDGDAP
jgi:hypothetical protein